MKKVILIFLAAIAFSCGNGRNQSSETGTEQTEDNYSDDALEADTTATDTTSTPGASEADTVSTAP